MSRASPTCHPSRGNHVIVSGLGVNNAAVPVGTFRTSQWARGGLLTLGPDYSEAGVILHTSGANNVMSFIYTINGMPYGLSLFGSIVGPAIQMYFIDGGGPRFLAETSTSGTGHPRRLRRQRPGGSSSFGSTVFEVSGLQRR